MSSGTKRQDLLTFAVIGPGSSNLTPALEQSAAAVGAKLVHGRYSSKEGFTAALRRICEKADLVIVDDTESEDHGSPQLMFALGFIGSLGKRAVVATSINSTVPYRRLLPVPALRFDPFDRAFDDQLTATITEVLDGLDPLEETPELGMASKVFISYSHRDKAYLDRLLVHLRPLERRGAVTLWADTKIETGDVWKEELEAALNEATIAVLLVSADFLASGFIVDNELPPLLLKAQAKGARIVPVILKPCGFLRDDNLARFQAANDPARPIIALNEAEQEAVYDLVARDVERAVGPRRDDASV